MLLGALLRKPSVLEVTGLWHVLGLRIDRYGDTHKCMKEQAWITDKTRSSYLWSFFITIILSGVRLSPLGTAATIDGDCGAIGGMKIGRGNRSTRRKPGSVPFYRSEIPHVLTRV
jgi:hypothetical protein